MKILIAAVMFLLGLFIGILVVPTFKEFSNSMYVEEEYSSKHVQEILRDFGISMVPPEASVVNLFLKQDGEKKELWVQLHCPAEAQAVFLEELSRRHSGHFNGSEPPMPKMQNGNPITWWTYHNASGKEEYSDLCVGCDEFSRDLFLYTFSEVGEKPPVSSGSDPARE